MPSVTPYCHTLMSVTTRPRPWGLDESERGRSEDGLQRVMRESEGGNDLMDRLLAGLSSNEGEVYERVWPEEGLNHEESGNPEFDDGFEVTLPMTKRRKLEKAVAPGDGLAPGNTSSSTSPVKNKRAGISRRVQGRLQGMLSLPFDVLFLIFSELGPMDLVNLARTSKSLRNVLMSRKSIWVWIVARRNAGVTRVPDPPEDMSEPAWALLLFGPAVCSQCSTKNIHRVDFALRRRLCTACRKKNFVPLIKFRTQCPGLKESVMDFLPYTKFGGWTHRRFSNSRFYWKPDLYEIGKRLAELEEDRDAGKPGAQQRLISFCAERSVLVDSIVQSSAEFEKWAKEEAEAQARNARERRTQRREALKGRILAAGYDGADIDLVGMDALPGANVDRVLTEEAWRRIRAKVEMKLSSARKDRLLAERRGRELEYRNKAEQCYSDMLRQILPMQRLYLPKISQARELFCFRDLLNPDRDVQPAEWEQAAGRLSESLSEWMTERRDRCTRLLPLYFCFYEVQGKAMEVKLLSDPSINRWRDEGMVDFAGQLELATSVFRHPSTNTILIGRDACHAWKMKGELEFVERGAAATHAILEELQLDPAMTTASILDQLNKRFICANCPQDLDWFHRSWRSCVLHFIDCSETDHTSPKWRVVNPFEMAMRGDDSVWYPTRTEKETWLCNHCADYLAPSTPIQFGRLLKAGDRWAARWHVQFEHDIANPIVDQDIFSYPMFV